MHRRLTAISDTLENISLWIGSRAAWASVFMMVVIMSDVILRRYFVIGSTRLQEMEWHIHGFLFLMTLGYGYAHGAHVRIELFREKWSERRKAWVELLGGVFFLIPYCLAVIWFGWDYTAMSFANNESSATATGLPYRWIIKGVLVFGFILLLMNALSVVVRSALWLIAGDEDAHDKLAPELSDDQKTL